MMMMGIRLTGRAPFDTVFLHGLVRDAEGRKMSKSLGNVVDPVDVVASVGADALRFTLATGTTPGQDLNLNPERLTSSRNLTNKLWNAGKFVLLALARDRGSGSKELRRPAMPAGVVDFASAGGSGLDSSSSSFLPLTDRWILGSYHRAVARVTAAYDRLDYGDAGRGFAEFFWGDFTDWYLEAAKVRLNPPTSAGSLASPSAAAEAEAEAEATRAVLLYVFEGVLALAHPIMPFVTEKLWRALPKEGGAGKERSDDLISAAWPAAGPVDEEAMAHFSAAKELVTAVRNARAEYGVELGRRVPAELQVADEGCRAALSAELAVIASLAKLDLAASSVRGMPDSDSAAASSSSSSSSTVTAVVRDGLQAALPMAGLFDAAKELARLDKQRLKAAAAADKAAARLQDPKFASNAPAPVVAKATEEAEALAARVAAIDAKIEDVKRLA
jgi:valyl-tRNA synthetase